MDDLNLNFLAKSDDLDTFVFNLEPSLPTLGTIIPSPSSVELNNGHFDPHLSLNYRTPTSMLAPITIPLQTNEVNSVHINSDNLNLGLNDPLSIMNLDQNGRQTLAVNEQFTPTFPNPLNSHELPAPSSNYFMNPLMGYHDDELSILDNFPNQNQTNEPILPPYPSTQGLQINNLEQLAPSNLDGLNFPLLNALEQPPMIPYFGSQAMNNVGQSYPFDSILVSNISGFENSIGEIMNHDPMGVVCFLAGVVRPSPDVSHIYKCGICFIEFPTAQAFGGHMKSHAKRKKDEEDKDESGKGKKAKGGKKISSLASSSSSSKTKAKTK